MKTLCLLANEYPYGSWEPYLEGEVGYYKDFDRIWVCSLQLRDEHRKTVRKVPDGFHVIPVRYVSRLRYFAESLFVLSDGNLYREIGKLIRQKRFNPRTCVNLFVFLSRSHHEASEIDKALREYDKNGKFLFYSYRFEYQPYVAALLKKRWKADGRIICRAHRYDLYENLYRGGYIPLREYILDQAECVFPCSKDGTGYLSGLFPDYREKIQTKYLGTADHGEGPVPARDREYVLVSCSNAVAVKRIHLITEALSEIKDIPIRWIHFGDGPLLEELKASAGEKLSENIRYEFRGHVDNSALMDFYSRNPVDAFVNVSSSEGIPVSIMEALSFGIPCIATDVGGTAEIIRSGHNGILLGGDFAVGDLVSAVRNLCHMNTDEYSGLRNRCRSSWEASFDAGTNYTAFSELISDLAGKND